jgi:hypothetical protein
MTEKQISKLCFISQTIAMGMFRKPQDTPFIRKLEAESDEYKLSDFEAMMLNKVYLDNAKAIRKLERMQL